MNNIGTNNKENNKKTNSSYDNDKGCVNSKNRYALTVLTDREHQTLTLIAGGFSDKDIAERLKISERTVNCFVERIRKKLDVNNRTQAVVRALLYGLLNFEEILLAAQMNNSEKIATNLGG